MKTVTLPNKEKNLFLGNGKRGTLFMVVNFMCSFLIIVTNTRKKQIKGIFILAYPFHGFRNAMVEQNSFHDEAKSRDVCISSAQLVPYLECCCLHPGSLASELVLSVYS